MNISGVVVPSGGLSSAMFFAPKKDVRPNEGLSEWPQLFTISYFKELDCADWLCEGINRGSKPRFTE
ncbi:hypothetical protein, partial [Klebsiella quasipneumoniae]|uniref:hypothetical protein n=1 Tax=Klebsiella quasipneumoniae TaxID=1463165 RepID=UPI001A931A63